MLKYSPAVFAVGRNYEIMVPVTEPSLFWVEVDGKSFYDEQNGIMRSLCTPHRVRIPAEFLDRAKEYTVCERAMLDRKPYFAVTADTVKSTFSFQPLPEDNIRVYHIADTHNKSHAPVNAAKNFGQIDLLVLNGDIPNDSGILRILTRYIRLPKELPTAQFPSYLPVGITICAGIMPSRLPTIFQVRTVTLITRFAWGIFGAWCLIAERTRTTTTPNMG